MHILLLAVNSVLLKDGFEELGDLEDGVVKAFAGGAADAEVEGFRALGLVKTFEITASFSSKAKLGITSCYDLLHVVAFLTDDSSGYLEVFVVFDWYLKSACVLSHAQRVLVSIRGVFRLGFVRRAELRG